MNLNVKLIFLLKASHFLHFKNLPNVNSTNVYK